ncbi:MAG: MFS transporter [Bacteroidales bacterium]
MNSLIENLIVMLNNLRLNKILTPAILLVSLVSLFTDVASEMLYPVMPVFLQSIGFSVLLIGILEGLAEMVAGLSKGYFGQLSDRLQQRVPFIRTGYALSAISKPMMALLTWPWWIFVARTTDRLGKGVRTSARDALLSDETTKEHKGTVFGFHRAMDTLGAAIGPMFALAWLWFNPGNYKALFLFAFIPGVIAVVLTFLLKENRMPSQVIPEKTPGLLSYLGYWKRAGVQYRLITGGLFAFTLLNSSDAFLLLSVKSKGFSDNQMIICYIFYNLVYALLAYPMGRLGDRIGLKRVILIGLAIFSIVYAGFGVANTKWHFIILFFLYALYAASSEGIAKAWISNQCKKEETATALGFFNSLSSFFAFAASSIGGFIWYQYGPKVMFLFSSLGVGLVIIYLLLVLRKN